MFSLWLIGVIAACCFSFIVALLVGCGLISLFIWKKKFLSRPNNNCEVNLATDTNISHGIANNIINCKDNVAYETVEGSNNMYEVIGPANPQQNETVYETLEQAKMQSTFNPDPSYQTTSV